MHIKIILRYNYSRDDEEIYKEFLEIANELIPHIIKIESSGHSARSIIKDVICFAHLLRFYDGICQWEEGSATPVLHIGWAKPLVTTISKFDAEVRAQVEIVSEDSVVKKPVVKKEANGNKFLNNNNNNYCLPSEQNTNDQELIKEIESKVSGEQSTSTSHLHPSIEALTAACSEKILNPEYLLQGGGSPFVGGDLEVKKGNNGIHPGSSKQVEVKEVKDKVEETREIEREEEKVTRPIVYLRSQKMRGLKDLLLAEKLNTQAIQLQLTAQSQVQVGKKGRGDSDGVGIRPKRTRRE